MVRSYGAQRFGCNDKGVMINLVALLCKVSRETD